MASKENKIPWKIIIISFVVLLFIAGISVGIYYGTKPGVSKQSMITMPENTGLFLFSFVDDNKTSIIPLVISKDNKSNNKLADGKFLIGSKNTPAGKLIGHYIDDDVSFTLTGLASSLASISYVSTLNGIGPDLDMPSTVAIDLNSPEFTEHHFLIGISPIDENGISRKILVKSEPSSFMKNYREITTPVDSPYESLVELANYTI
jgi:hypothetical protein